MVRFRALNRATSSSQDKYRRYFLDHYRHHRDVLVRMFGHILFRALLQWFHDQIENGDGAARHGTADPRAEQRVLRDADECNSSMARRYVLLPTCSAFSMLRRIFEGLSGPGKRSSVPARGPVPV